MDEQTFQSKLSEMMARIEDLPAQDRDRLLSMAGETKARHEKLKGTVSQLQESLDYLRLSVKYLVFDLEATRRENRSLREMIEQRDEAEGGWGGFDPA